MQRTKTRIDISKIPSSIAGLIGDARIYNSSCSETAKTFLIEGKDNFYLKIRRKGELLREYQMTSFLYRHGFASRPVVHETDGDNDYLLTEALAGEDGISGGHLEDPRKLAGVFGESLRELHSLSMTGCPYNGRTAEMLQEIEDKIPAGPGDTAILAEGKAKAVKKLHDMKRIAMDDAVLHGDYCLPNIIMEKYHLRGFVDLGYGGIGDRHYDIFWGIWTLNYNLRTNSCRDIFLDAYGRRDLDRDRLELCRLIAGLTG
ncbi:MAG: aminoglycoside 3'-phosphotransferase [Candidatus Edwardsbacteria bacterium]|nr:aminoglycoside 3'-phosphotransferase [Candidatus Edwardsbacteria bacterium]